MDFWIELRRGYKRGSWWQDYGSLELEGEVELVRTPLSNGGRILDLEGSCCLERVCTITVLNLNVMACEGTR